MEGITNEERAEWAGQCIELFKSETRTDDEDALCDLLANLMHYASQKGQDFDNELRKARYHYEAEVEEEKELGQQ